MKKFRVLLFSIFIIFIAVLLGIYFFRKNNNNVASKKDVEIVGDKISEEIYDDCTDEWDELSVEEEKQIIETNSGEEKISPNCLITLRKYYKGCNHYANEYINASEELVNKNKEELQKEYEGWNIEKYSSTEIVLYREFEGECGEHYILREKNGKIVIYRVTENNEEVIFEETDISVDYLDKRDQISIENGIKIFGKEKLNQVIEDFE